MWKNRKVTSTGSPSINYRSSRSRNTVVDGEPVAARCSFLSFLAAGRLLTRATLSSRQRSLPGFLLPSVAPYIYIRCQGKIKKDIVREDKEDRTPVTQTPLPLWSFVWSGLRVLSTGDVTSYSISEMDIEVLLMWKENLFYYSWILCCSFLLLFH